MTQTEMDGLRTAEDQERIDRIRSQVVGMYSAVPWPGTRRTDEEMGWRLRCLDIRPEDYTGKNVVEVGCGTGDYALWYATHGAKHVTGIDLSDGSLAAANRKKADNDISNATFLKQNVLQMDLPDNEFDYTFSVGVLHHTGDPFRGFQEMVRITRPGGIIIISLYNSYSRFLLYMRQRVCAWLGGDDIDKRARWGESLFPFALYRLNKRYHGLNRKEVIYDSFACPHESLHSAREVLGWFDATGIDYLGSFAPLRVQDYPYIFALPEYREFRKSFEGFATMRLVGDAAAACSRLVVRNRERTFPRPSLFNAWLCQMMWIPFGLRISCFTLAGRKRA